MKKILFAITIAATMLLASCSADPNVTDTIQINKWAGSTQTTITIQISKAWWAGLNDNQKSTIISQFGSITFLPTN
jgi:hypothetical protein